MKENLKRLLSGLVLCALLITGLTLPASAAQFRDVPANYWAADSIRRCAEAGLFQGKTATRFGVGEPMSRGAFVVVLCRLFGWELEPAQDLPFTDVPEDAWYASALATALHHGAVTTQTENFRPEEALTREELAVALVRGLGYGPIAGLSQELDLPFTDVSTNRGYITMAWDMGLVNGTSETTFSPDRQATREQCAVMLMRLHDKLYGAKTARVGIIGDGADIPELAGFDVIATGGGQLISGKEPRVACSMSGDELETVRQAASAAGAKQLLYVKGSPQALTRDGLEEVAYALNLAVYRGGYDGLFLDFPGLRDEKYQEPLNRLTASLKTMLGSQLLYVAAEAPQENGHNGKGYDYKTLSRTADHLVVRVSSDMEKAGDMAIAPVQPLEDIYRTLRHLRDQAAPEKLTLWMSTTATVWKGTQEKEAMTGLAVDALLADESTDRYYSQRYGCSYLLADDVTVWYPDAASARERAVLGRLFGVNRVCLGELSGMSPTVLEGLK